MASDDANDDTEKATVEAMEVEAEVDVPRRAPASAMVADPAVVGDALLESPVDIEAVWSRAEAEAKVDVSPFATLSGAVAECEDNSSINVPASIGRAVWLPSSAAQANQRVK